MFPYMSFDNSRSFSKTVYILINTPCSQLAELRENKVFTLKMYRELKIYYTQWLMIKLSLNLFVLQTGAARARFDLRTDIILLRTHWQKVTEFMVPLRIDDTEEFLT